MFRTWIAYWGWTVVLALLLVPEMAAAQDETVPRGSGTAVLAGWPDDLDAAAEDLAADDYQLLPRLDALTIDYRYAAALEGVQMSFVLTWAPGDEGVYDGSVRPYEALPSDIRMVAVELLADVVVDGRTVTEMIVAVDTMALAPHPSVYAFEVDNLAYDAVFLDTPADAARRYFEAGVDLRNLRVNRIAFAGVGEAPPRRAPTGAHKEPPRSPQPRPPRSVYEPRVGVHIGWRIGPRPYHVGSPRPRRTEQPRGDAVGRTSADADRRGAAPERGERAQRGDERSEGDAERDATSTRSGQSERSTKGKRKDSDDEDDEESLVPASVVALAAVGAVAVAGGTVGYHGTGRTPLGLTAGWARSGGGALLQASINDAVLGADGRQHLEGKVLGFVDVLDAPVQPAVGLGALATAEGSATTVEPSFVLGAVGNLGRVLVIGGYDVLRQAPEFGFAINFRFKPAGR